MNSRPLMAFSYSDICGGSAGKWDLEPMSSSVNHVSNCTGFDRQGYSIGEIRIKSQEHFEVYFPRYQNLMELLGV